MGEKEEKPEEKPDASPPTKKPRRSRRPTLENPHNDVWMKNIGTKLFRKRSSHRLNKINNCKEDEVPETFDSEYYLDQLDLSKRMKFIHVTKVTKEYMEEERQKQLKLARKLARELLAMGNNPEVGQDNIQEEKNDVNDGGKDGEEGNDVMISMGRKVFFTKKARLSSSIV